MSKEIFIVYATYIRALEIIAKVEEVMGEELS